MSDLLASAKLEAENLYRTWEVVSLARLASDGEIEVRTRDGMRVVFGTHEDYLRQIARLDLLVDGRFDRSDPARCGRSTWLSGPRCPCPTARPPRRWARPRRSTRRRTLRPVASSHFALQASSTIHIDIQREL